MTGRSLKDTIAAVATPPGRGGIAIVRTSGPRTLRIASSILARLPKPRVATYGHFLDEVGGSIDDGVALFFPGPHSFTGEDVVELHGHGGPVVMDLLLKRVVSLGARLARPGEFSERAFLNEKLDLAQAEAIADLIDSHTAQAARSAMRSLRGEFSGRIRQLVEKLIELRAYVEAALDFPEEEIDFLADVTVLGRLHGLQNQLEEIREKAHQGSILREGMRLVIAGRPNVGKSSLLNRLAGHEAVIVSHIPGTTRDVVHQDIQLDGMPIKIIDTAGLRASSDPIEQEGVRRAWREIETADLVVLLVDDTVGYERAEQEIQNALPKNVPVLQVWNKIDLGASPPGQQGERVFISAKTGAGLKTLRQRLKDHMGFHETEGIFIARRRHLQALEAAGRALGSAEEQLRRRSAGELMAEELRVTQQALGEITGEFTNEDLLGEIFSNFCIGK